MSGYLKNVGPKKHNKTAKIPWNAIMLAFVFIFNPNISIIDPLPDILISIMSDISNDTCMFPSNIAKSLPRYVRQEHTSVGGVSADMDIKIFKNNL